MILAVAYLLPLFYLTWSLRLRQAGGPQPVARDRPGMADVLAAAEGKFRRQIPASSEGPYQYHPEDETGGDNESHPFRPQGQMS